MQLLTDKAPDSISSLTLEHLAGKVIACDASIAMYQFLISTATAAKNTAGVKQLTDPQGNPTA